MDLLGQAANAYMHRPGTNPGAQGPGGPGGPGGAPHQGPPQGQGYPPQHQGPPHPPGGPPPGARDPHQGLPPGWAAEWSAADNRYYYVNTHTGERTWNRPGGPPPGPPADPRVGLPPGWAAEWDAPDKRWFYVNTHTGQRTWDRPHGGPLPPAVMSQVQGGHAPVGYGMQETKVISSTAPAAPAAKNHNMAYGAAGAVAGLAGGALLMHEGHKVGKSCNSLLSLFSAHF